MNRRIMNWLYAFCLLAATGIAFAGPVNINTADADTLAAELTGVGPALAAAIVSDRQANGLFPTAESLARVRGIGSHIVEINRENILVGDAAAR
jgi:competence protein ComEA